MSRLAQRSLHLVTALASVVALGLPGAAAEPSDPAELMGLSLKDLMNVKVMSVSRRPERLRRAAAAIYVIGNEELRRSGATSIPEALRRVPGVQVTRTRSGSWSVSARGFNGTLGAKMLVLIDGRSVFSPLYAGVFWEAQDVVLEDVDRIEVIRGPGGALWGANAVNGVINVITRSAHETEGALAVAGGGTEERAFGALRYGAQIDEDLAYRAHLKYADRGTATARRVWTTTGRSVSSASAPIGDAAATS